MSKELFGLIITVILAIGSLIISWKIQEADQVLGYIIGVFGFLISAGIGINIMTWEEK